MSFDYTDEGKAMAHLSVYLRKKLLREYRFRYPKSSSLNFRLNKRVQQIVLKLKKNRINFRQRRSLRINAKRK